MGDVFGVDGAADHGAEVDFVFGGELGEYGVGPDAAEDVFVLIGGDEVAEAVGVLYAVGEFFLEVNYADGVA